MDLWKAFRIARHRKWEFVAATLVALVLLGLTAERSVAPTVYVSKAKVLLTPPSFVSDKETSQGATLKVWFADQNLLKELILSQELLGRVASRLGLTDGGQALRDRVELRPVSQSQGQVTLLAISVTADSGSESKKYTQALVEEFISYVEELSAREFASTRQFLEDLVAEARANLDRTETSILKWQAEHEAVTVEEALAALADREGRLEAEKIRLQQELAGLGSELEKLQGFVAGRSATPPWAVLGQERAGLTALQSDVASQRLKLAELRQVFTEESQQIREQAQRLQTVEGIYAKELDSTVRSYVEEKQSALSKATAALKTVDSGLAEVRKRRDVGDQRLKLARLQRQLGMYEENYNTLMTQLYRARVSEQGSRRSGAISMLEAPDTGRPTVVVERPNSLRRILIGFPFCLIFGFTVVLLLDYLASSMRIRPRIEETLNLPVLGTIPRLPDQLAEEWEALKSTAVRELVAVGSPSGLERTHRAGNGNGNGHSRSNGNGNGNGHSRSNGNGYRNGSRLSN